MPQFPGLEAELYAVESGGAVRRSVSHAPTPAMSQGPRRGDDARTRQRVAVDGCGASMPTTRRALGKQKIPEHNKINERNHDDDEFCRLLEEALAHATEETAKGAAKVVAGLEALS